MKKFFKIILILPLIFIENILCKNVHKHKVPGTFINRHDYDSGITSNCVAFSPLNFEGQFFAAITNFGDFGKKNGSVSVYSVNNDGIFSYLKFPVSAGENPTSIAFSPLIGNRLFAALVDLTSENVLIYDVDVISGEFKEIASYNVVFPFSVAFAPIISENKLFFAIAHNGVSIYSLDLSTNKVLRVDYKMGMDNFSVSYSPITKNGDLFIAVVNYKTSIVSFYKVDKISGRLQFLNDVQTGTNPNSISFSPITPNGDLFAAVSNSKSNSISVYKLNINNYKFDLLSSYPTELSPNSVSFSPITPKGDLFAAVANHSSNTVSVYNVDKNNGKFMTIGNYSTGDLPFSVAFSPINLSGKLFSAVANGSGKVSVYQVELES